MFTQADSVLPDVYDPQALNRYSYCLNNPLKYEDPDGHVAVVDDILLGIAICGTVGLIGGFAIETTRQLVTYHKITDVEAICRSTAQGGVAGVTAGIIVGAAAGSLALAAGVETVTFFTVSAESVGISTMASMSTIPLVAMSDGAIEYLFGTSGDESFTDAVTNESRMVSTAFSSLGSWVPTPVGSNFGSSFIDSGYSAYECFNSEKSSDVIPDDKNLSENKKETHTIK